MTWRIVNQQFVYANNIPVNFTTAMSSSTGVIGDSKLVCVGGIVSTGSFVQGYTQLVRVGELVGAEWWWYLQVSLSTPFVYSVPLVTNGCEHDLL